ncbi:hypothetical protein P153DRAFT_426865 [Dothidotthia symphoricarpi CBS 119687]|uniref:Integral membrane protein n=1 Tax=Dothidotthia symphoricarpi CBS 119687 TaxID=1392245 RepID=A0A6A5ZWB9_9PLEO|nr:uncharacterized protein P153DRAFT_426865 [Dothidotthia symphoricarpi CBS 119687]KAF2124042.1 hypothetical protein P153DRAFT_426865 [Dothidotthia symphoricarpi CBS 119687]
MRKRAKAILYASLATIRASYVRASRSSLILPSQRPFSFRISFVDLEARPPIDNGITNFEPLGDFVHSEKCDTDLKDSAMYFDGNKSYIDDHHLNGGAPYQEIDHWASFRTRLKKMYTIFPYRDPIWLVAVMFVIGSIDLVINAFFCLLPHTTLSTVSDTEETIAIPSTVLIGSILFLAAAVFDTLAALNVDCGTLETSEKDLTQITYRPTLIGTPEFKWIPSFTKTAELTVTSVAFQAGLIVLFGGVIFMFAGIVDFPGVVSEEDPLFGTVVFGPQILHGALFLVANVMLALSEQECWYFPKVRDPDWQGAFLNSVGGLGFMMAGFFLFREDQVLSAAAAMAGSWAFLIGSLMRWYVVMDVW